MEKHKSIGKSMPELSRKSKSSEYHKVQAESRINQCLQNKRKLIHVHRNADEYSKSVTILLTPWEQKDMELVLRAVGERVTLINNKLIQRLYSLDGKRVKSVEELEENKVYVAAANEAFTPCKYGHQLPHLVFSSKLDRRKYEDLRYVYSATNSNLNSPKEKQVPPSSRVHSTSSQHLENGTDEARKNNAEARKKMKPSSVSRARSEARIPDVTRSSSYKPSHYSAGMKATQKHNGSETAPKTVTSQPRPVRKPHAVVVNQKEPAACSTHEQISINENSFQPETVASDSPDGKDRNDEVFNSPTESLCNTDIPGENFGDFTATTPNEMNLEPNDSLTFDDQTSKPEHEEIAVCPPFPSDLLEKQDDDAQLTHHDDNQI